MDKLSLIYFIVCSIVAIIYVYMIIFDKINLDELKNLPININIIKILLIIVVIFCYPILFFIIIYDIFVYIINKF